jgi:hypothetical protein
MALLQLVQVYAFQRELLLKLASECARGVPGSAIFLSHGREREQNGDQDGNGDSPGGASRIPTVFYIKVGFHPLHAIGRLFASQLNVSFCPVLYAAAAVGV